MLRGENMRFRPAIFIWFVFAQSSIKFHKNDDNRKLKTWSFRLRKNDFSRLYNERARALQSSITFFFIHPVCLWVAQQLSPWYPKFKLLHAITDKNWLISQPFRT